MANMYIFPFLLINKRALISRALTMDVNFSLDDFPRSTYVYLLSYKSNTTILLQAFIVFVERYFNAELKILRRNYGMEFHSDPMN